MNKNGFTMVPAYKSRFLILSSVRKLCIQNLLQHNSKLPLGYNSIWKFFMYDSYVSQYKEKKFNTNLNLLLNKITWMSTSSVYKTGKQKNESRKDQMLSAIKQRESVSSCHTHNIKIVQTSGISTCPAHNKYKKKEEPLSQSHRSCL